MEDLVAAGTSIGAVTLERYKLRCYSIEAFEILGGLAGLDSDDTFAQYKKQSEYNSAKTSKGAMQTGGTNQDSQ